MFVICGVEDGFRPALLEYMRQTFAISYVGNMASTLRPAPVGKKSAIEIKHPGFALVNTGQDRGFVFKDLSAKFSADGAGSSCHEHSPSVNCGSDGCEIDLHGIPPQQIIHVDVAEMANAGWLCNDVPKSRHGAELYGGAFAQLHESLHLSGRGRRYSDKYLVNGIGAH